MAREQASAIAPATFTVAVARTYANYLASLRCEGMPAPITRLAKFCLADAIGCAIFGKRFAWSQIVLDEATATGSAGPCVLPGVAGSQLDPTRAALVSGAMAHAFELDSLCKPGAGVHPGATVALPALAVAQACGASGRELIAAIVGGCEVMFRIGAASLHSPEKIGFHAPGITGVFGAAAAASVLMKLKPQQTANAFGIAGSLAGGLLAFSKAGSGGMVKRLHLGRAAESGVIAARLGARGYEGPEAVFEGQFGVLEAFCDDTDPPLLTKGLGSSFEIEKLCLKRYACHVTAHAPVQLLRGFIDERGIKGEDIAAITLEMSDHVVGQHNNPDPADIMLAQYSVPFTVALAAFHDPSDPRVFSDATVRDPRVRLLAKNVDMKRLAGSARGWGGRMSVRLVNGETLQGEFASFLGTPETPFNEESLRLKFDRLVADEGAALKANLFDSLMRLEDCSRVSELKVA